MEREPDIFEIIRSEYERPQRMFDTEDLDYYCIRSVTIMNKTPNIFSNITESIESAIDSLMKGHTERFDIKGFPSTLLNITSTIVPTESNVIIASQLFPISFNKTEFNRFQEEQPRCKKNTYETYFKYDLEIEHSKILWLGSPSFVFNYKRREKLVDFLKTNCIDMFWNITSFRSTECINNFFNTHKEELNICQIYQQLFNFCNTDEYRSTRPFSDRRPDFITNFDNAIQHIKEECNQLQILTVGERPIKYQRYNELFSYFFPWDLEGIEIGGYEDDIIKIMLDKIVLYRYELLREFTELYRNLQENVFIKIYDTRCGFLLKKFINTCKCFQEINDNKIKKIILYICKCLRKPIQLFQYTNKNIQKNYLLTPIHNLKDRVRFKTFIQTKNYNNTIIVSRSYIKLTESDHESEESEIM